ncbi:hypothetical protein MSG28_011587 [Choristoneura fumiferana]|uniref:Uncharacterized protein n=1 Tax=Choristoneura fumiferana TaxID=7141 RepID=A0ACC0JNT5_CHOFU|nr:hypothetical protein MSG28_011587 [Choristoneura fumiferana]
MNNGNHDMSQGQDLGSMMRRELGMDGKIPEEEPKYEANHQSDEEIAMEPLLQGKDSERLFLAIEKTSKDLMQTMRNRNHDQRRIPNNNVPYCVENPAENLITRYKAACRRLLFSPDNGAFFFAGLAVLYGHNECVYMHRTLFRRRSHTTPQKMVRCPVKTTDAYKRPKVVLTEQGLGKYCDRDFIQSTSREMQEALDLSQEEMDTAANLIILQERKMSRSQNLPNDVESILSRQYHPFHQPPMQPPQRK